jgi:hypothetical protein
VEHPSLLGQGPPVVVPTVVDLPQRRVSLAPPRLGRRVAWAVAGSCVLQPAEGKEIASFPGAPGWSTSCPSLRARMGEGLRSVGTSVGPPPECIRYSRT